MKRAWIIGCGVVAAGLWAVLALRPHEPVATEESPEFPREIRFDANPTTLGVGDHQMWVSVPGRSGLDRQLRNVHVESADWIVLLPDDRAIHDARETEAPPSPYSRRVYHRFRHGPPEPSVSDTVWHSGVEYWE